MCGVFGIIGNEPVAEVILNAMLQLQHRGQDGSAYSPMIRKSIGIPYGKIRAL